ncbi:uncharacterized protein LOC142629896 [Castanea sativa]|uniref:uncharacterized protein LOC142629896 n=1 Tax=Castanea sativa TaxID=21020 RepID=UPI003F64ABCB
MRLLSWTYQGLGNPWTSRNLRKIMREQTPNVCFFMETRLDKEGFEKLYDNLPFPNWIIAKNLDSGGGIALIWKNEVSLEVINFTAKYILAKVVEDDGFVWFMTGCYGWPETNQREKSWKLLAHLKTYADGPWLCIGDFNAFLHASEKQSKRPAHSAQVDAFREALELCQLEDLGYRGYPFTWTSDRLPIVLQTQSYHRQRQRKERWFKFEESWLLWEDCEAVVNEARHANGNGEIDVLIEAKTTEWTKAEYLEVHVIRWFKFEESWLLWEDCSCDQMEECLNAVSSMVTPEMQQMLSNNFSAKEVVVALFQMGPTKAPGHDGMDALFYQKFWHVVGETITMAVLYFLNSGNMVLDINHTNIVLIPKVKNPEKMSKFRSISLCNVIYKIISKVLANRLKQVLPQIISLTQSTFMPVRLITDNVLVVYETLHTMHCRKKAKKGSLALKLDISKAYDLVE